MDYFDNSPLIKSSDEVKFYNTSRPAKINSVGWIILASLFVAGRSFYHWYKHKKKEEQLTRTNCSKQVIVNEDLLFQWFKNNNQSSIHTQATLTQELFAL